MTIQEYLDQVLQLLGITDAQVTVTEPAADAPEGEGEYLVQIDVTEDQAGLMIGYHGETLVSLQRLVRLTFSAQIGDHRLVLNVNDYRTQRAEQLKELANQAAFRVIETGEAHVFPYLPANERFIIHTAISENPEFAQLTTFSQGEGQQRRLVVELKA